MFRKAVLLVGVLALVVSVPQAQAGKGDWKISVAGGLAAPVGDFGSKIAEGGLGAKLGFVAGPSVDYMVTDNISVGVDGSFTRNNLNTDEQDLLRAAIPDNSFELKYTQIGGGAHIKYWFPMPESQFDVYVVAGAGAMNFKAESKSTDPIYAGKDSKTQFMAHGGLGAGYKVSEQVTLGLVGDFNYVKLDDQTFLITSANGFGVKAAVTFGVSGGGGY